MEDEDETAVVFRVCPPLKAKRVVGFEPSFFVKASAVVLHFVGGGLIPYFPSKWFELAFGPPDFPSFWGLIFVGDDGGGAVVCKRPKQEQRS